MTYRACYAPPSLLAKLLIVCAGLLLSPQVAAAAGLRDELIKSLETALVDKDVIVRIRAAQALLKFVPTHKPAAQELIRGLVSKDDVSHHYAGLAITQLIPSAPPPLVEELMKLLTDIDVVNKRRAAGYLAAIDPKALP